MRRLISDFCSKPARVLLLALISFGLIPSVPAEAGNPWRLEQAGGDVRLVKSGLQPISLTAGDELAAGDWIETGADGSVTLVRGASRIVVGPDSRMGLPRDRAGGLATRILQSVGTLLLKVEKKAEEHFEVQTPHLAAVVKGTTFSVGVWRDLGTVHVVEGVVEVRELASGERGLVHAGQTATVRADEETGVDIDGEPSQLPAAAVQDPLMPFAWLPLDIGGGFGPGSAPVIEITVSLDLGALDVGALTNGLLQGVQPLTGQLGAELGGGATLNASLGGDGLDVSASTALTAQLDLGESGAGTGVSAGLSAGASSGAAGLSGGAGVGASAGGLGASAGLSAGVSPGGGIGASAGASLSGSSVGVGLSVGGSGGPSSGGSSGGGGLLGGLL